MYLSYHDNLTTLHNRRYVEKTLPQLLTDKNMPLSMIMADMNGLKITNDVFGHDSGDKLLACAARLLKNELRNQDIVARWGGDEFLILMSNTDSTMCQEVCDRLYRACGNSAADPVKISLSMGCATIEHPDQNISDFLKTAENKMYSRKISESKAVRREIILGMQNMMCNDCIELEHIDRLQNLAREFGQVLGLESQSAALCALIKLCTMHDIGKIAIPKVLLDKKEALTDSERDVLQGYIEIGYRLAQSIGEYQTAEYILALREWWDGTGYPNGLKTKDIPYVSRIMSILEAYDVMTHDGRYKPTLSGEEALNEIKKYRGRQFDPELSELFIKMMTSAP